jgi:lysozyme family protein
MPRVTLTPALRREYEDLLDRCDIRPDRAAEVDQIVGRLVQHRARYETVAAETGVPWYVIAVIHAMETGLRFDRHLHNGDPLTARTVMVPAGHPRAGQPPFTWEASAKDALALRDLSADTDWSAGSMLYEIEGYNGWGYRLHHAHVLSPYLWSGSSHYTSGKYVADGRWSDTAVSKQVGAAALLRRMAERNLIKFVDQAAAGAQNQPLIVSWSRQKSADPQIVARVENMQRWLNTFPGIFVKVDGHPGDGTSEAFQKVTGSFLPDDPRREEARVRPRGVDLNEPAPARG